MANTYLYNINVNIQSNQIQFGMICNKNVTVLLVIQIFLTELVYIIMILFFIGS